MDAEERILGQAGWVLDDNLGLRRWYGGGPNIKTLDVYRVRSWFLVGLPGGQIQMVATANDVLMLADKFGQFKQGSPAFSNSAD